MTTKTISLYTLDELSDDAKERARNWWRECEAQDFGAHRYARAEGLAGRQGG